MLERIRHHKSAPEETHSPRTELVNLSPSSDRERSGEVEMAVNPNTSGRVVISSPGLSTHDKIIGRNRRYERLAERLQEDNVAARIRLNSWNPRTHFHPRVQIDRLRTAIEYAVENSEELCGTNTPEEIMLLGMSAGGAAASVVAPEYPDLVTRLVLWMPARQILPISWRRGMRKYEGELFTVFADGDHIAGESGPRFASHAKNAKENQLYIVKGVDHHFDDPQAEASVLQLTYQAFAKTPQSMAASMG